MSLFPLRLNGKQIILKFACHYQCVKRQVYFRQQEHQTHVLVLDTK